MSSPIAFSAVNAWTNRNPDEREQSITSKTAILRFRSIERARATSGAVGQQSVDQGSGREGDASVRADVVSLSGQSRRLAGLAEGSPSASANGASLERTEAEAALPAGRASTSSSEGNQATNGVAGGKTDQSLTRSPFDKGKLAAGDGNDDASGSGDGVAASDDATHKTAGSKTSTGFDSSFDQKLSAQERQEIEELKERDREVRSHEQAHRAAGGGFAGPIELSLERGPDGEQYATNGSVSIDVSPVKNDPVATIAKMRRVQAAATAPTNPSGADLQVASRAAARLSEALHELAKKRFEEMQSAQDAASSALDISA